MYTYRVWTSRAARRRRPTRWESRKRCARACVCVCWCWASSGIRPGQGQADLILPVNWRSQRRPPPKIERFVRGSNALLRLASQLTQLGSEGCRLTQGRAGDMGSGVADGQPSQWPAGQCRCRRQPPSGLAAPWTGLVAGRPLPHASNERQHQPGARHAGRHQHGELGQPVLLGAAVETRLLFHLNLHPSSCLVPGGRLQRHPTIPRLLDAPLRPQPLLFPTMQ